MSYFYLYVGFGALIYYVLIYEMDPMTPRQLFTGLFLYLAFWPYYLFKYMIHNASDYWRDL